MPERIIQLSGILSTRAARKDYQCLSFAYPAAKSRSFAVRHSVPGKLGSFNKMESGTI
jgi:hypothetical protein